MNKYEEYLHIYKRWKYNIMDNNCSIFLISKSKHVKL
jgi:hypothetical protein